MDNLDLDPIRAAIREELAPIRERLAVIEERIALLPDLHFLHSSSVAQQVVQALRKAEAKPRPPIEGLPVPGGSPSTRRS